MNEMLYLGKIIPTPKKVVYASRPDQISPEKRIHIIVGLKAQTPELTAAQELKAYFRSLGWPNPVAILREDHGIPPRGLRILVGTPDAHRLLAGICRQRHISLSPFYPGKEGYVLRFWQDRRGSWILAGGSDPAGAYFAVQSLKQLCRKQAGGLEFQPAAVDDYPTFGYRGMFVQTLPDADYMGRVKFNSWDIVYCIKTGVRDSEALNHRWRNPSAGYRRLVRTLASEALKRGLTCTPYVNPLWDKNCDYGGMNQIKISDPRDIEALYRTFRIGLEAGSRSVCLALDDFTSLSGGPATGYILTNTDDRRAFHNNLGRAHAYLCRRIYEKIKRDYPRTTLIVCPAYYVLPGNIAWEEGAAYLRELSALPPEVAIQWVGPIMRSPCIRPKHIACMTRLIGRPPCYWDNSPYGQHQPPYNLMDTYAPWYCKEFPAATGFGVHSNGSTGGILSRISMLQIGDYLWNPEAYDAIHSRERAIAAVAGRGKVRPLIRFHDVFQQLHDRTPFLFMSGADAACPLDRDAYRDVRRQLGELREVMEDIEQAGPADELRKALRTFYDPLLKKAAQYDAAPHVKRELTQRVREGLLLPPPAFYGGMPASKYGVPLRMICGRQNVCNRMRAVFYLKRRPGRDVILSLRALDGYENGDNPAPTRIRLAVNNHTVFEGPSEFILEIFLIRAYDVHRQWLRAGKNILTVEVQEDDFHRNFRVAFAKLVGPVR